MNDQSLWDVRVEERQDVVGGRPTSIRQIARLFCDGPLVVNAVKVGEPRIESPMPTSVTGTDDIRLNRLVCGIAGIA
jgi:hypothetical protein